MKYSTWWTDAKCLSRVFLNDSIVILLTICAGREFPNIYDSIEEKVLRFIRSKTFTDDIEAIVTGGACEIGNYIIVHVNIIKTMENFKNLK